MRHGVRVGELANREQRQINLCAPFQHVPDHGLLQEYVTRCFLIRQRGSGDIIALRPDNIGQMRGGLCGFTSEPCVRPPINDTTDRSFVQAPGNRAGNSEGFSPAHANRHAILQLRPQIMPRRISNKIGQLVSIEWRWNDHRMMKLEPFLQLFLRDTQSASRPVTLI